MSEASWRAIIDFTEMAKHNFDREPFVLSTENIKQATRNLEKTSEREVRILCKQDTREARPEFFKQHNLFILPIDNKSYYIVKGEGYIDIVPPKEKPTYFKNGLGFLLETANVGDGEMQHLDYAFAAGLTQDFVGMHDIILTIRGRKRTPRFNYNVGEFNLTADGVQTEVDAGYEGRSSIILIEAKNVETTNIIIRQLYFPFKQWKSLSKVKKPVSTLFFCKRERVYSFWEYIFRDEERYESIELKRAKSYLLC